MFFPASIYPKPSLFKMTNKFSYVLLALIVLLAATLRIYRLDYQSLDLDEIFSMNPTQPGQSLSALIESCKKDQPPAYFLLLWSWFKVFPYNEFWGRMLSVIFGLWSVVAIFFLGKAFKDSCVGLVASLMTTLNFYHLYFSQNVRFYSLLFLLTTLSYHYYLKCLKRPSPANFTLYALCSIGLVYTHYFGTLVIIAQALSFLIIVYLGKKDKRFLISGLLAGLSILAAFSFWLPTVLSDAGITSFWIGPPTPWFFIEHIQAYMNGDNFSVLIMAFLIGLLVITYLLKAPKPTIEFRYYPVSIHLLIVSIWVFVSYALPYLYSIWRVPILVPRYTIIVLPALFVMSALGWSMLPRFWLKILVLVALVCIMVRSIFFLNWYYINITKTQFREVTQAVIGQHPSATIYSPREWYFNCYLRVLGSDKTVINPAYINFEQEVVNHREIWVLRAFLGAPDEHPFPLAIIDKYFTVKKTLTYYDAYAVLYVKK